MRNGNPHLISPRRRFCVFAVALATLLGACGDTHLGNVQAPNPLLPGPYPVGVTTVTFVDPARNRTLRTEIWYPAAESARGMPASPITDFDPVLAPLLGDSQVPLTAVRDVPISRDAPFPLIAFSHGNGGVRFQNTFQTERLASHGFVVVAPDHTGDTILDLGDDPNTVVNRPLDISFLYDEMSAETVRSGGPFEGWIDTSRPFGVTGHSLGSYTSLAVASSDARVAAALPMAAPGPVSPGYSAATFLMLATEDKTIGLDLNQGIRQVYSILPGPRWLGEVIDAGHYSFTIACLTGSGLGDGDGCGEGKRFSDGSDFAFTPAEQVWAIVDAYSVALFGRYLRGIDAYDATLAENVAPEILRFTADPRPELSLLAPPGSFAHEANPG
jgi:predicted dienelactone hydrolase